MKMFTARSADHLEVVISGKCLCCQVSDVVALWRQHHRQSVTVFNLCMISSVHFQLINQNWKMKICFVILQFVYRQLPPLDVALLLATLKYFIIIHLKYCHDQLVCIHLMLQPSSPSNSHFITIFNPEARPDQLQQLCLVLN